MANSIEIEGECGGGWDDSDSVETVFEGDVVGAVKRHARSGQVQLRTEKMWLTVKEDSTVRWLQDNCAMFRREPSLRLAATRYKRGLPGCVCWWCVAH